MLMINDCFQTHVFKPQLQGFLTMLKHKASHGTRLRKGLHTARLDELYGIVPPFEIKLTPETLPLRLFNKFGSRVSSRDSVSMD